MLPLMERNMYSIPVMNYSYLRVLYKEEVCGLVHAQYMHLEAKE